MLQKLTIKNFTIIEDLELDFGAGFNVMTGETGAGKSIIIDAINLLSGQNASEEIIKAGKNEAIIEGIFKVDKDKIPQAAKDFLEENEDEIIILRKISKGKPSQAKVNNQTIVLKKLKELSSALFSISGQHEYLSLFSATYQLKLLDAYAEKELEALLNIYQVKFKEYKELKEKLEYFLQNKSEALKKLEFLQFQIEDIDLKKFLTDEEEILNKRKKEIKNIHFFKTSIGETKEKFANITEALIKSGQTLKKLEQEENGEYKSLSERAEKILIEAQDILEVLDKQELKLREVEEIDINELEERLDLIFRFKNKYNVASLAKLGDLKNSLELEFKEINLLNQDASGLEKKVEGLFFEVYNLAKKISKVRKEKAIKLAKYIKDNMRDLNFEFAEFEIEVIFGENLINENGADKLNFLISTNLGEPKKVLDMVASGGELSRILLAIKTVFSSFNDIPTIIFDEIDAGVGGVTALKIGEKIKKIAGNSQVLCVTHLPQLAKFADHHYVAKKISGHKTTVTQVVTLNAEERTFEIQRMVGGKEIVDLLR